MTSKPRQGGEPLPVRLLPDVDDWIRDEARRYGCRPEAVVEDILAADYYRLHPPERSAK